MQTAKIAGFKVYKFVMKLRRCWLTGSILCCSDSADSVGVEEGLQGARELEEDSLSQITRAVTTEQHFLRPKLYWTLIIQYLLFQADYDLIQR